MLVNMLPHVGVSLIDAVYEFSFKDIIRKKISGSSPDKLVK